MNVNTGGVDILAGYKGAWYTGIGLSGIEVIIGMNCGAIHTEKEERISIGV